MEKVCYIQPYELNSHKYGLHFGFPLQSNCTLEECNIGRDSTLTDIKYQCNIGKHVFIDKINNERLILNLYSGQIIDVKKEFQ